MVMQSKWKYSRDFLFPKGKELFLLFFIIKIDPLFHCRVSFCKAQSHWDDRVERFLEGAPRWKIHSGKRRWLCWAVLASWPPPALQVGIPHGIAVSSQSSWALSSCSACSALSWGDCCLLKRSTFCRSMRSSILRPWRKAGTFHRGGSMKQHLSVLKHGFEINPASKTKEKSKGNERGGLSVRWLCQVLNEEHLTSFRLWVHPLRWGNGQGKEGKGKELAEKCVWEMVVMQGDFLPFQNG